MLHYGVIRYDDETLYVMNGRASTAAALAIAKRETIRKPGRLLGVVQAETKRVAWRVARESYMPS